MRVQIQSLNSATHSRKDFDCGNADLNKWLQNMASQHQAKNISRTFVAVDISDPATILGFYALSVSEVDGKDCPPTRGLPSTVPVARIGRFAVASDLQGKGLGKMLMLNALDRVRQVAMNAGVAAVVVDAKDEKAAAFYEKRGFTRSPADPLMLVLYTETLQQG